VPAIVVIPAGATSQTFDIATTNNPPTTVATITASYAGISQSATLTVAALPSVVAMTCSPAAPSGGAVMLCTGTLSSAAPSTGWQLAIASSSSTATPASPTVTVAPGARTFQFSLQTSAVSAITPVTIQVFEAASGAILWTLGISVGP
jgi:hypothetical protein